MKLSAREAARFCAKPDNSCLGALLHGPDPGLLSLRRSELVASLSDGDDLRLTTLEPADIRKDPALINDALRARGFFPGRRVVLIEDARDTLTASLKASLADSTSDDAFLVVVAPGMAGRSSLKKLFESDARLASLAFYSNRVTTEDLADMLATAGLVITPEPEALALLATAAVEIDSGSVRQLANTIATYGYGRSEPLTVEQIERLLPISGETALDSLVAAVANGDAAAVGPLIRKLTASGASPARILIASGFHFRNLLAVAYASDGPERALMRVRPPVFGPRRDAFLAQTRRWTGARLEKALRQIFAADRALRSAGPRPDAAMVERTLIRVAMLAG